MSWKSGQCYFMTLGWLFTIKELTRLGLKETFMQNMYMKGKRLLNYMDTVCVNKNKKVFPGSDKVEDGKRTAGWLL